MLGWHGNCIVVPCQPSTGQEGNYGWYVQLSFLWKLIPSLLTEYEGVYPLHFCSWRSRAAAAAIAVALWQVCQDRVISLTKQMLVNSACAVPERHSFSFSWYTKLHYSFLSGHAGWGSAWKCFFFPLTLTCMGLFWFSKTTWYGFAVLRLMTGSGRASPSPSPVVSLCLISDCKVLGAGPVLHYVSCTQKGIDDDDHDDHDHDES